WTFAADPPDALESITILPDVLDNYVAHINFKDLIPGSEVRLEWSSLVLARARDFSDLPAQAPLPDEWPEEARPWLASSWSVQADDPRIIEAATALKPAPDAIDIIRKTMTRAASIMQHQSGRCDSLDAVQALEKQGSCTSCANLVAALLRANGLPTRILAGYPTWSGPLQTHYTVETWIPDYGWYPIESTMLQHPLQPYQQIQVSLVPVAHEDESGERAAAAPGVPYLSLTEYVGFDESYSHYGTLERMGCDHAATAWQLFPAPTTDAERQRWKELERLAAAHWKAWLSTTPTSGPGAGLTSPLAPADFIMVTTPEELVRALGL
ncbi:MAG: transglutaminase domain-containing protein, partial [Phycisphaerales bacterium]|nr:transglutaminase domain-containing protein [Phycisphaerales bacterium]